MGCEARIGSHQSRWVLSLLALWWLASEALTDSGKSEDTEWQKNADFVVIAPSQLVVALRMQG